MAKVQSLTCPRCGVEVKGGANRCPRCFSLLFQPGCQGNCSSCQKNHGCHEDLKGNTSEKGSKQN